MRRAGTHASVGARTSAPALPGTAVTTIAGGGHSPGPASAPPLQVGQYPTDLFFSAAQKALYVSDAQSNVVRKIQFSSGITTTEAIVAGNGSRGSAGDKGPATAAQLNGPAGITLDAAGNIYFADNGNHAVRVVAAGTSLPFMPGVKLVAGDIYTVVGGGQTAGANGVPATSDSLQYPRDVAIDSSGNLLLVDGGPCDIQLVAGSSKPDPLLPNLTSLVIGDIYVVAGDGACASYGAIIASSATTTEFANPFGVAQTPSGNLVVQDGTAGLYLVSANTSDPLIPNTTLTPDNVYSLNAGGGYRAEYEEVAVDGSGNLYIADAGDEIVTMVAASTTSPLLPGQTLSPGSAYSVAGSNGNSGFAGDGGPATSAQLSYPNGVALDTSGDLFIGDTSNNRVREVSSSTDKIITIAGDGVRYADGVPGDESQLQYPNGPTEDAKGDIFFSDGNTHTVRMLAGTTSSPFLPSESLSVGDIYTVAGNGSGTYGGDNGPARQAGIPSPGALAVDSRGNLLIADTQSQTIRLVAAATASPLLPNTALTVGDIYVVAGTPNHAYYGSFYSNGDGGAATQALLSTPMSIVVDKSGSLLIADHSGYQVRLVAASASDPLMPGKTLTTGDIYTMAGRTDEKTGYESDGTPASLASLGTVNALALDPSGNVYITDGCWIYVVAGTSSDALKPGASLATGDIYHLAGPQGPYGAVSCTGASAGDGGPVGKATFAQAQFLSVDPHGNLYVTDEANPYEIRLIAATTSNQLMPGHALIKDDIYSLAGNSGSSSNPITYPLELPNDPRDILATPQGNLVICAGSTVLLGALVPSPPTSVTASSSNSHVSVHWSGSLKPGSGPVIGYQISRSPVVPGGAYTPVGTTPASSVSFTDTTPIPGGTYTYGVQAITLYGDSAAGTVQATAVPTSAPPISTIAGGYAGLSPSPFTATQLGQDPQATAIFKSTAYVYDSNDSTIRAVNLTTGSETRVAGNGIDGHSGDGAAATAGEIGNVTSMQVDPSGNLAFVENDQGYVRLLALATSDKLLPGKALVKGDLYTVAGNGGYGDAGNGMPAVKATFEDPVAVATDSSGNLLVADDFDGKVRLIAGATSTPLLPGKTLVAGDIYPVAGTGVIGNSGNGGSALVARLGTPTAITVDRAGNLLIGDSFDGTIRLVAGAATDPLLAGAGLTKGRIYALAGAGSGGTGDGGPATSATFQYIGGLASTSAGDLLVADSGNNEVRLIAGNTSDSLLPGKKLTKGYIYALLNGAQQQAFSGDGGAAAAASALWPTTVSFDGSGNVFVADWGNNRLRKISVTTGKVSTVAGNGTLYWDGVSPTKSPMTAAPAIATDGAGNVFVADTNDFAVRMIAKSTSAAFLPGKTLVAGHIYTIAGTGQQPPGGESLRSGQPATSTSIMPVALTVDHAGNLIVGDAAWPDIRLVAGVSSDPLMPGIRLTRGDMYDIAGGGGTYGDPTYGASATQSNLLTPMGLVTDPAGNLYASIYDTSGDQQVNASVVLVAAATSNPFLPGQTLTKRDLYFITGRGSVSGRNDGGPAALAGLQEPEGLALDSSGDLTISDFGDSRVRLIAGKTSDKLMPGATLTPGDIYTVAGGGSSFDYGQTGVSEQLGNISAVALDPSGNLALDDASNNAIWLMAGSTSDPLLPGATLQPGSLYKIAGNGTSGYAGNGSAAVAGEMSASAAIAFDSSGNLFIADTGNAVVREVPK
ncbi:MAG TPA: hypothetical protein VFB34_00770 [Chloroflexota bacterium]|nr:hypothetical protein [Chloroflexota bacterium]